MWLSLHIFKCLNNKIIASYVYVQYTDSVKIINFVQVMKLSESRVIQLINLTLYSHCKSFLDNFLFTTRKNQYPITRLKVTYKLIIDISWLRAFESIFTVAKRNINSKMLKALKIVWLQIFLEHSTLFSHLRTLLPPSSVLFGHPYTIAKWLLSPFHSIHSYTFYTLSSSTTLLFCRYLNKNVLRFFYLFLFFFLWPQ